MPKTPIAILITSTILALAVVLRIADPGPIARLRLSIFDSYLALAPRVPDPAYPVRIVDVDDASLAKVGQWPWPRTKLAEMITKLKDAGARAIALDMIFAEPDRWSPAEFARHLSDVPELKPLAEQAAGLPTNDEKFAAALAAAPTVLGFSGDKSQNANLPTPRAAFAIAGDDPKLFVPSFSGAVSPLPELSAKAPALGAVNWLPERDQVVRRVPLLVSVAGKLYPSLSLEALRLTKGETTVFVKSSGGSGILSFGQQTGVDSVRVGDAIFGTDADGQVWQRFSNNDAKRYVSAHKVLDGSFNPAEFAGRIVLIGSSAAGLLDLRATPLETSVPGVEIHAQALEQMLSGDTLFRPAYATGLELAFLIAAGAIVSYAIRKSGAVVAAILAAASIVLIVCLSWLAYLFAGYLFDPIGAAITTVLVYICGSLYNYIRSETERARIRSAFGHYVAPAVVEELALDPTRLRLGGEMRPVTLLFSDVRGFSQLSEGMEAEALIRFVNELFTPLVETILANRGTIDKFMGDAVMAFWNAPLTDAAHAENASRAALKMLTEVDALNAARGPAEAPIRIGIGLNTGVCCVGNVGSPERFDYSVLGDVVNTAARLEEATKTYGVPIITGAETASAASHLAFLEIGTIALRGKARPERVYALLGDETMASSARFLQLQNDHGALIEAVAARQWSRAQEQLGVCRAAGWPGLATLFEGHAAIIAKSASANV